MYEIFGVNPPWAQTPLGKSKCIYFRANMLIWIGNCDWHGEYFLLLWKSILQIVDFWVDNNVFKNTQNAPEYSISIKKNTGVHAPGPPSTNLNPHHYRAIYAPGM